MADLDRTHETPDERGERLAAGYRDRASAKRVLTPADQVMVAALLDGATDEQVELVLRAHLPVEVEGSEMTLCMCDLRRDWPGPIGHRYHVASELRKAGLLRD